MRQRADAHHRVAQAHADRLEPTTVCTSVVSVVRRDSTSPVCVVSKNSGLCSTHVRVDGVAQVGRDALAEPAHHVEARRREQRRAPRRRRTARRSARAAPSRARPGRRRRGPGRSATSAPPAAPACSPRPAPGTAPPARCGRGTGAGRAAGRTASAAMRRCRRRRWARCRRDGGAGGGRGGRHGRQSIGQRAALRRARHIRHGCGWRSRRAALQAVRSVVE